MKTLEETAEMMNAFERRVDEIENEIAPSEGRLAAVNRIAIMGELCRELVNELNNPVAIIAGYAGQLRRSVEAGSEAERQVARIADASDRVLELLMNIQRVSQPGPPRRAHFSIQSAIRSAIDFSQPLLRTGPVALEIALPVEPYHCVGDADLFAQILMNLISNARDAIVATGRKSGKIGIALEGSGDDAFTISISDDGIGMDETTSRRAFAPFFTTKASEKAAGLGLTVARKAARDFGGELRCESAPGAGSKFRLTLPHTRTTR